jgi:signal recognition particle receptor subunit beta
MSNYKVIFTGPVGAGKTTAISSVSDIPLLVTDEMASDMTKDRKQTTTVAMDYGRINLSNDDRIHLYGTPGQERFDFMWDILTEGGLGLVLLVDNSRLDPIRDLHFFANAFKDFIEKTGMVVGVTRMDEKAQPTIDEYYQEIQSFMTVPPIFEVDARKRDDVSMLIQTLLYSIDPGLQE